MARAWPRAINRPRKPVVVASVIAATIASGVVGIGDYLRVNGANELSMAIDVEADAPLTDRAGIGLQSLGQQSLRSIARKRKEQVLNALDGDAVSVESVVDRVDERQVFP
jgi:hypothetical protein